MNSTGMNTAASDAVMLRMVKPISCAPSSAACSGSTPASTCRMMFSSITIASSTTKPNERMIAISDRLLRLKPSSRMTTNVPRTEKGSASAGNRVADPLWRNAKITSTTRTSVTAMVMRMSVNDARMDTARSVPWMR